MPKRVLVRAVGPSLVAFGVTAAHPNPRLELCDGNGVVVAGNDDWEADGAASAIAAATRAAGAFALPGGSRDAAIVVSLVPGNYTAMVSGPGSGVVLVETYDVP